MAVVDQPIMSITVHSETPSTSRNDIVVLEAAHLKLHESNSRHYRGRIERQRASPVATSNPLSSVFGTVGRIYSRGRTRAVREFERYIINSGRQECGPKLLGDDPKIVEIGIDRRDFLVLKAVDDRSLVREGLATSGNAVVVPNYASPCLHEGNHVVALSNQLLEINVMVTPWIRVNSLAPRISTGRRANLRQYREIVAVQRLSESPHRRLVVLNAHPFPLDCACRLGAVPRLPACCSCGSVSMVGSVEVLR
jgi:hypothetical protein